MKIVINVQEDAFNTEVEQARLTEGRSDIGAIVSFTGWVRDFNERPDVSALTLEHFPGMTEKALEDIVAQAAARWSLFDALVIHRVGPLKPLDQIVLVAVTSSHRGEAFAACEFIMDYLKTQAPFWKKESGPRGEQWLEPPQRESE